MLNQTAAWWFANTRHIGVIAVHANGDPCHVRVGFAQVLNQTAAWWFANTRHIIDNAVLDVPDPNVTVMKKCSVFPVEFVVRGFMTGGRAFLGLQGSVQQLDVWCTALSQHCPVYYR
jgi:hypothetical protein